MTPQSWFHAECNFRRNSVLHSGTGRLPTCRSGKCGTPSAVGRFQARQDTPEAAPSGSFVLDCAEGDLEELEIRSDHRAARNGHLMATQTIQTVLVAIVS